MAAPARRGGVPSDSLSIGEVLSRLRDDFPDVTISKIRFLEDQGLVDPERTPSGYRRFTPEDVDRLRYVLTAQRDHYLPLRVIREHLDAGARGVAVPGPGPAQVPVPARQVPAPEPLPEAPAAPVRRAPVPGTLDLHELCEASGADEALVAQLQDHHMVRTVPDAPGRYDTHAVQVASLAAALSVYGVDPRHLRAVLVAAERDAVLVEQVVAPMRRVRNISGDPQDVAAGRRLAELFGALHTAFVERALQLPAS